MRFPIRLCLLVIVLGAIAKLFHAAWLTPPPHPPLHPAAPEPTVVSSPAVPFSTFGGESPLARVGPLPPMNPTSSTAFIPLPPVRA